MKKVMLALLIVALVAAVTPALAGQKKVVTNDPPTTVLTQNGRLSVTKAQLNSNSAQIYVTRDGKVISPMPTDAAMLWQWEATQLWIDKNIGFMDRLIDQWGAEHRGNPTTDPTMFLNQRLQAYLQRVDANAEITAMNQTMVHTINTSGDASVINIGKADLVGNNAPSIMYNGGCGPKGFPATQVKCCVGTCDESGCDDTACHICDCDNGGVGCCVYMRLAPR